MLHDQIADSLLALGVHPVLVLALAREYCQLKARVKIADADFSDFLPFRRGGRQGGVETPEVFNVMIESAAGAVVDTWRAKNYGFTLDDKAYISHLVWADNFFLLAKSPHEAHQMVEDLSAAIYAKGFRWKACSLGCLSSLNMAHPLSVKAPAMDGETLHIKAVDHMLALGVQLDRRGSTDTSVNHRMAQADKCFYKHVKLLSDPRGRLADRSKGFMATSVTTLLYNAEGWHLTGNVLTRVRRWENDKLRKMFKMKRSPDEDRNFYLVRTSARIKSWFSKCGIKRAHHRLLQQLHSWAEVMVSFRLPCGSQPLHDVLKSRCIRHWRENQTANSKADPENKTGWRHASSGNQSHWEQPLVSVYGDAWWDAPALSSILWRSTKSDFVQKLCATWSLDAPEHKDSVHEHTNHELSKGCIAIPQWTHQDLVWQRGFRSFECRVDNKLLAEWLAGVSGCKTSSYMSRAGSASNLIQQLLQEEGWCLRSMCGPW
eukprot:9925890-Karenia_brevis.AAC.1